jgi:hypothetical protein
VTKIPPEHTAAKSLEDAFRALGEERARAARGPRRRAPTGTRRVAIGVVTSVLVVAGVATGTKVFTGDGGALRPDDRGLTGVEGGLDPAPAYRQLALASTADPREPQPWGLRIFKSAKGFTCLTLGRVVGGRLGVIRDGQFKELPARAAGVCGSMVTDHLVMAVRLYYKTGRAQHRTVVYGAVDRTVRSVGVLSIQGRTTPVPIAADGTFVIVRAGDDPFHHAQLVVDGSSGRRVRPLGP